MSVERTPVKVADLVGDQSDTPGEQLPLTSKMDLSDPFKGFGTGKSDMLEHEKASRVRDHLDRKMNRLDTILSDADLEISQLNECADRLAAVQSEYEKVHVSILQVSDTIEEEEEIYARFETKLYKLMRNAKQRIAAATVKEVLPSNVSKQTSRVKLPEIKLPKFDGSLQNWTTFRDNFKTLIDAAPELSEVDKFTYLISCLTEDAKRVIEVIEVTTANYSVAWDLLCTRYENKYLIVKSHVDSIFAISPIKKECPESIMRLVDEFERNLKMLEKLGERPEGWSTLLVFRLSSCLDPATLRQWETHKRSTEVPTYDELVKFLRDHCRVLQSVESVKLDPSDKTSSQFRRKPVQKNTAAYSTVSLGAAEKCVFCRDVKHSPYKCVMFRNMAVNDRKDLVKNKKLCFNCLSLGHTVKDCPSGTCRICHKKHHTMLHEQSNAMPVQEVLQQQTIPECQPGPSTPASSNPETPASLNHCFVNVPPASNQVSSTVLLQTAVVKVCDCNGTQYWARALLDSASQLNIVTERLVQRLRLPRIKEVHSIGGIGESKIMSYSSVMVSIKSIWSAFRTTSKFHVLSQVTRNLPVSAVDLTKLTLPLNIELADPNFHEPGPIDMKIGMDLYYLILEEGLLKMQSGALAVQKTVLGWVIAGRATVCQPSEQTSVVAHVSSNLDAQLRQFWELEACQTNSKLSVEESKCEQYFDRTTKRNTAGRFVVSLPTRDDKIAQLGESKSIALRRFLALERRLETRPQLKAEYSQIVSEYINLNLMVQITENTTGQVSPSYYMPHHCVLRPDKTTTKLRVVFDASCSSSSGVSLNDCLMVGPILQDDLMSILLRFRMPKFVLVADIEKMYRQILVADEDRPLQRILWRNKPTDPICTFELNTVTYGTSCAPYLATKTLQHLAKLEANTYPEATKVLANDFYMDDMLTGVNSVEEGLKLSDQLLNLLQSAGLCLRKWTSNCSELLEKIPIDLRDDRTVYDLDSPTSCIKTLGLKWQPTTDNFLFETPEYSNHDNPVTKRIAVSDSAKLFDPLGLVGPVIVAAKMYLQELWRNETSWDEPLNPPLQKQWRDFRKNLAELNKISIQRWVLSHTPVKQIQLHGFCDASEKAYGACIYIRSVSSDDTVTVNLLTAKSKVAPLATSRKQKRVCLPRLELSAALLLAHLYEKVSGALKIEIKPYFWSDSSIVLHWLAANPSRWKTFVANRVSEIQHLTANGKWNHVPGIENPADIISRGMDPAQLQHATLWWNGPNWLNEEPLIFPTKVASKVELPKEDLEERVTLAAHSIEPSFIFKLRSSFGDLKRLVAWILRFAHNAKLKNRDQRRYTHLTTEELNDSIKCLVRLAQHESFAEDFKNLEKNGFVANHSKLKSLNPYIEAGILRVGGRLRHAEVSNDRRHPMILPSNHPLTDMIAMFVHLKMLHASPQFLTTSLRERFWPLRVRNLARKTVHSCLQCFRCRPTSLQQIMGDLPMERVSPALPFVRTGVDLCGPIAYRYPHRKSQPLKGYVVIFVCMVVKAVHIDLVTDLTTDAFIAALRRFIARRGRIGSTPDKGVPDMTCISDIDENGINRNLKVRYERDQIYTYTGSILIAVNPYKEIDCYTQEYVAKYHGQKLGLLEPHVFAMAEAAYRNIRDNNTNQSCVISGESGAGKTETTKFILQYLCSVTCDVSTWVQQQILEANTILEAFGNAKTIRNDNSSRFGKFMQVCFDAKWCIKGCIIQDYLLEQSRITFQSPGERNYHVLYQLVAEGKTNGELAAALHLRDASFYRYLNASGGTGEAGTDQSALEIATESKRFEALRLAFNVLQISQPLIDGIFRVLSAIMWLGNLDFADVDGERCELAPGDGEIVAIVAQLLGLQEADLVQVLLKRQINVRGNITEIPLKLQEAGENRHAMAKALYSRTFAWLISHINTCINPGQDASRFLGVLDIFGFENFNTNSFEQLCINYTNEKLHKFFNHYVFALEQEIYRQEEIKFSHIQFTDNTLCLELIEKPPRCILKLLTEQCHMPKGSDTAYLTNLHGEFESHGSYVKGQDRRHWESEFGIRHYAGCVSYTVKGFVDKNRDVQQDVLFDHMSRSTNTFVQEIASFQDLLSIQHVQSASSTTSTVSRGTSKGKLTVSDTFRQQLQALVDVLQSTNPWYVRCIKPNAAKLPNDYDDRLVLDQLRYLGMLDIIRIRREGFPVHLTFDDFVQKYQCLTKRFRNMSSQDQALAVIRELNVPTTEWQLGRTKVFLRSVVHEPLEDARKQVINAKALIIQRNWKRFSQQRQYGRTRSAALKIQHAYKGWKLRIEFLKKRRAAIVIQSHLRGVFAREVATALREMRRVDEEMRKRERLEAERREREAAQAEADRKALEESERVAKEEILALSQMAEQINSKLHSQQQHAANNNSRLLAAQAAQNGAAAGGDGKGAGPPPAGGARGAGSASLQSNDSVDLDNLFAFLSEVQPNANSNAIIDEIGEKMDNLVEDLDVELESVIQQEIEGLTSERNNNVATVKSAAGPLANGTGASNAINGNNNNNNSINNNKPTTPKPLGGIPSLPEPTMPPPPPPIENNNHTLPVAQSHHPATLHHIRRHEEPIYEAVIHLKELPPPPMDGHEKVPPIPQHQSQQLAAAMPPPPPPVHAHQQPVPPPHATHVAPAPPHHAGPVAQPVAAHAAHSEAPPQPPPHAHAAPSHAYVHLENGTGHKLRPKSPAVIRSASPIQRTGTNGPMSPSSPKHSRPSSRASSTGGGHPFAEREQRRKYRVEKKLQEMQQLDITEREKELLRDDVYYDILEFAESYYNTHERSPEGTIMATLTRKGRKSVDMVPKYEMITYYRGTTIPSSHIHMYDPENVTIACNIFRDLCKYIRGELNSERELQVIQFIIGQGIEREELRDEIFVQCMRQATNNPSVDWTDRVWLLLCLTIVAFQPSKLLFRYFVSFLKKNLESLEGKLRQYVQWCLDNCKNTKVRCRQYPPSSVEVAAMRRLGTIVCRFFFLDGRTKAIDVHPTDTASDAVAKLAEKLGLGNIEGWAIYQSRPDGEEHVKSHDYLYDIIAAWEAKQTKIHASSSTLRKNATTLGSGENRFVFKKRLFKSTRELSQDPVEVNMLYAQAVYSVVKCDDFPVSEKVALQLAGLQAQVALGDPSNQPKPEYYSDVPSYLPERISKTREEQFWVPILAQAHRQYGSGRTELTAKVLYLSCVMQYPLYGTTMFAVSYRGYWSYGNSLILGVNCEGIILIKPDDKFVLYEFRYAEVESIMLDPSDSFITISLNRHTSTGSADQQRCFVFETAQKNEIGSLIVSYYPALSNWITENEVPPKKSKGITNEDRVRLHHNLVVCRRHLVDTELLRKPQDPSGGFLRNTLRRLSKHRLEKLRAEHGSPVHDHGETYKGFPHAYWAFSRQALPQSLSKLPDQEEQAMLQVFNSILTYAGLGQNGETVQRAEDEHITLIQSIMDRCMRKESLLNELYLQLIKQTTDHPDPNSRVNLRHWALLSLACSVILPPQKVVRKYLLGHLKRCASDFITEEGKYARFAEKCFFKTQGTRRRQWPPSREEIICTINRRPIYARFHFMDGQYHSVEFHPSSTSREVMEIVKKKIGLQENALGYAIYEVLGASERSLLPDEKVADVMSKWEKYRTAAAQAVQQNQSSNLPPACRRQHHLFLFKKHLFCDQYMNLDDPVEKELLYHQVLHGLRTERFPITEMEAIMLTALQGQLELGDSSDIVQDYRPIAAHCLPPRFVPNIPRDSVAMHHQSLRGTTPAEAKKSFLNLIQSWPLHKATIFDVMQSFTSNWPRMLWLAVDQKGLHLLEHRSRNTLCTYDYQSILSFSPNMNCLMIITGSDKKQSKVILTTAQAFQIANLIREYMEVLQRQQTHVDDTQKENQSAGANQPPVPQVPPHNQPLPPPHQHLPVQPPSSQGGPAAAPGTDLRKGGQRPPSMLLRQSSAALVAPQPS